jgi:hypothetical protein
VAAHRHQIKIELEPIGEPMEAAESNMLADAFVDDLKTDATEVWVERVQAAIAEAKRVGSSVRRDDHEEAKRERQRSEIASQISRLQEELQNLERT